MMGRRVAVWAMVWGSMALVAVALWGAVLQAGYAPVDSGVPVQVVRCSVVAPGYDDMGADGWNAWVLEQGSTNVTYDDGVWRGDGDVLGYSATEDSVIVNHRECV